MSRLNQSRLEHLYEIIPAIRPVVLYEHRTPTGMGSDLLTYDPARPINVLAERRNVDHQDERFFKEIAGNITKMMFHLWTATFEAPWEIGFSSYGTKIKSKWLIKEANGDEWFVLNPTAEMTGTRWRCPCVENLGERIIC